MPRQIESLSIRVPDSGKISQNGLAHSGKAMEFPSDRTFCDSGCRSEAEG